MGLCCLDLEKVVVMGSRVKRAFGGQSQSVSLPVPGRQGGKRKESQERKNFKEKNSGRKINRGMDKRGIFRQWDSTQR